MKTINIILMALGCFSLEIFSAIVRLFMTREQKRYYKEKIKNRKNVETKARAIPNTKNNER